MSEKQELIPSIVAAAIAAAGPRGSSDAAWRAKVNEAIPFVVAMMGEGSRQWRVADEMLSATVFVADYLGYEYEESSTRCVVKLGTTPSKRYPEGVEPIRTPRTDGPAGKSMRARLDALPEGSQLIVWKAMESSKDDMKVRVLAHFEVRPGRAEDRPVHGRPVEEPGAAVRVPQSRPAPAADPVVERFEALPPKVKVAVVKRLRDEGISFPDPGPDNVDRMIRIILDEEGK